METAELEKYYQSLEKIYFGEEMHERDEIENLPNILKDVKVFVDIGASLGQYTYFANKIIQNGKIYAIEADPLRYQRLKELCDEWQQTSSNKIQVIHAALGEKNGTVDFFITNKTSGSLFTREIGLDWEKVSVNATTLDTLFVDSDPDLCKIDVEGAEYRVLEGANHILERGNCRFFVEVHPWADPAYNKTEADLYNLFLKYGYDFHRTKRHWLFEKSDQPLKRLLKNKVMTFVVSNKKLRKIAKTLVIWLTGAHRR
jgi:FkbM family methyltransferase